MKWNEKPIIEIPKRPRSKAFKTYIQYIKESDYRDIYKSYIIRNYQRCLEENI